MSSTPITPTASKAKTPCASSKRKRVVDDDMVDGMDDDETSPFIVTAHKEIKAAFGEDTTWHGARWLAAIESSDARKSLQDLVHLWLVFATAFDPVAPFGPKNSYSVRHVNEVARFVVEQWDVRPSQVTRHPAGGKTVRYLLAFDRGDMRKILAKFPRDWTKLTRGIGCRVSTPAETFISPFPAIVSHVPVTVSVWTVKKALERLPWIREVTDVEWISMDGGIKTDKMSLLVDTVELENAEISRTYETFTYVFEAGGHTLEIARRLPCTTCGVETHGSNDCPLRQRLVATYVSAWPFVNPESPKPVAEGPEEVVGVGGATEGTSKETGEVHDKGSKGKGKRRASKKRKVEDNGDPAAKKARV